MCARSLCCRPGTCNYMPGPDSKVQKPQTCNMLCIKRQLHQTFMPCKMHGASMKTSGFARRQHAKQVIFHSLCEFRARRRTHWCALDTHTGLFCCYERASCEQTWWTTRRKINSGLEEKSLCHGPLAVGFVSPFPPRHCSSSGVIAMLPCAKGLPKYLDKNTPLTTAAATISRHT